MRPYNYIKCTEIPVVDVTLTTRYFNDLLPMCYEMEGTRKACANMKFKDRVAKACITLLLSLFLLEDVSLVEFVCPVFIARQMELSQVTRVSVVVFPFNIHCSSASTSQLFAGSIMIANIPALPEKD